LTVFVVCGAPAASKSWVRSRAKPGDLVVDFDLLAAVLTPDAADQPLSSHAFSVVHAAFKAAIRGVFDSAATNTLPANASILETAVNDGVLLRYRALGARIVEVDKLLDAS
jgi:hypothetical protein